MKKKYECDVCGHVHEGDEKWKDTEDGWKCPTCGSDKSYFRPVEGSAESPTQKGKIKYECDVCGHIQEGEDWPDGRLVLLILPDRVVLQGADGREAVLLYND